MVTIVETQLGHWPGKVVFQGEPDEAGRVFRERLGNPACSVAMFTNSVPMGTYAEQKNFYDYENN